MFPGIPTKKCGWMQNNNMYHNSIISSAFHRKTRKEHSKTKTKTKTPEVQASQGEERERDASLWNADTYFLGLLFALVGSAKHVVCGA